GRTSDRVRLLKLMEFKKTQIIQIVILSLLLHLGAYKGLLLLPAPHQNEIKTIQVEFIENKSSQFVTDTEIGKLTKDLSEKAKFLSKLNRLVEREMRARMTGPTKNLG